MKQWSSANVRYFTTHMIAVAIGTLICALIPNSKSSKAYPVEITLIMGQSYQCMDVDSVVDNMAYRDGIKIKLDNVACIKFK